MLRRPGVLKAPLKALIDIHDAFADGRGSMLVAVRRWRLVDVHDVERNGAEERLQRARRIQLHGRIVRPRINIAHGHEVLRGDVGTGQEDPVSPGLRRAGAELLVDGGWSAAKDSS